MIYINITSPGRIYVHRHTLLVDGMARKALHHRIEALSQIRVAVDKVPPLLVLCRHPGIRGCNVHLIAEPNVSSMFALIYSNLCDSGYTYLLNHVVFAAVGHSKG